MATETWARTPWALADAPVGVVFVLVGLAIVFTVLGFVFYARARHPGRHTQRRG